MTTPESGSHPDAKAAIAEEHDNAPGKPTVIETIKGLHAGSIQSKSLSVTARRACVEYLHIEGSSIPEIAKLLDVCERTIARDRKAIQETYALEPDPKLVPELVGRLLHEANLCINRIRRAARDKEAQPAVRVDAKHRCYQILADVVQRLQQLGYLPTATQRIEADLTHHGGDIPDLEVLSAEMLRLRELTADAAGGVPQQVKELEAEFQRAAIAVKVQEIAATTSTQSNTEGRNR